MSLTFSIKKKKLTNISVKYFVFRSIYISGNFKFVHPLDKIKKKKLALEVSLEVSFWYSISLVTHGLLKFGRIGEARKQNGFGFHLDTCIHWIFFLTTSKILSCFSNPIDVKVWRSVLTLYINLKSAFAVHLFQLSLNSTFSRGK